MGEEEYYKALYEAEKAKTKKLTRKLVEVEEEYADAKRKLDGLKRSKLYKIIKPFWTLYAKFMAILVKIKILGSFSEVRRKLKSKRIERNAYKFHGTLSFPDAEGRKKQRERVFDKPLTFSILVPLYNTPEQFLREMIESVIDQTYTDWQLCLADGSDSEHGYVESIVRSYQENDRKNNPDRPERICYKRLERNLGISENTNACLEMARGDYIGLFDHDDLLHPSVLYLYRERIEEEGADFLYCDEATFSGKSINHMVTLHFKPDFAIDNLRANNYICHFSVFSKELSNEVGGFRKEFDGSQDHDMIFRLTAKAKHICHVPHILYYWRSHAESTAQDINAKDYAVKAAIGAVSAHLTSCGFKDFEITGTKAFATIFRIRYALIGQPKVSIIIPNRDHASDLSRCTDSIFSRTSYENYEVIVVENGSKEPETKLLYEGISRVQRARVVEYKVDGDEFNFSRLVNFGVQNATGSYILLLNNDTEVVTRDWIENLLMYAQREDVGAVGCKLYHEDYGIQHAGIVLGLGAHRTAGHTHYRMFKENLGYMGRLCYAQNVTAVTGACMMVSKGDWDSINGFDEGFAVALNDVDFCLRLREKGLLNVFTPFSELYHYESISRGNDTDGSDPERAKRYEAEAAHFREKWAEALEKGDPYYNPNFSLDYSNFTLKASPAPMVE